MIEIFKISLVAYMFTALGEPGMIFEFYQKQIGKLPEWLSWPLGECFICFTGQVCFWFYLLKYYEDYNLFEHCFFVSAGIFCSVIYNKLYNWLND
jgi:hypothetical protein